MGTRMYYQIGVPSILEYYNIIGVDEKDIDLESLVTESPYLEEILCGGEHSYLPAECQLISGGFQKIVARICESFDYSSEEESLKEQYYCAVVHLINVATSVNVIDEDSNDYVLYFRRVNSLLNYILASINALGICDVIHLSNMLATKDGTARPSNVFAFIKERNLVSLLPLLVALYGDEESRDFELFNEGSFSVDFDKIGEVISASSQYASLKEVSNTFIYPRPSYKLCLKMTPKE